MTKSDREDLPSPGIAGVDKGRLMLAKAKNSTFRQEAT